MHKLVNADLFPVVSLSLAKMTTGCRHTHTFIVFRHNCHKFFFLLIQIISLTVYGMKEQNIHLSLVSRKFTGGFNSQVVLGYYVIIC